MDFRSAAMKAFCVCIWLLVLLTVSLGLVTSAYGQEPSKKPSDKKLDSGLADPDEKAPAPEPEKVPDEPDKDIPEMELPEMKVTGERPLTSGSDQEFRAMDFLNLPRQTPSDLLRILPGIHISQHTGGGKAHQIFLRGFDCEHGQDFAGYFDDIPLNQVSQVHGEGYLDLHFLIPETIEKIKIIKGPYDPQYGNYAVAGVMNIIPAYQVDHSQVTIGLGSFQTVRGLVEFAWDNAHTVVIETDRSEGFTDPGDVKAGRLFTSHLFKLGKSKELKLLFSHYNSDYEAADVVPVDQMKSGWLDRYGSMDDSDGGETQNELFGIKYEHKEKDSVYTALMHAGFTYTDLFSNYTYYFFDQVRGDQMRLNERRYTAGFRFKDEIRHEVRKKKCVATIGLDTRFDRVSQLQAQTLKRDSFNKLAEYRFQQNSLGLYLKEDIKFAKWLRWAPGMRLDYFYYKIRGSQDVQYLDITDNKVKTRNDEKKFAQENYFIFSPKSSLIFTFHKNKKGKFSRAQLFLNYGEGFTSPKASLIANDEVDEVPKSRGGEISVRLNFFKDTLTFSPCFWVADKEVEMVFEPETGISSPRGSSHRQGFDFEARYKPTKTLYFLLDYFRASAKFKKDNSDIPGTPEEMITLGATYKPKEGFRGTFRTRFMQPRPLGPGHYSRYYTTSDVSLGYREGHLDIELTIKNLFNREWDDTSFYYESRVNPLLPAYEQHHITPGTPLALGFSITYSF